mgnify:CR=1 FL=1
MQLGIVIPRVGKNVCSFVFTHRGYVEFNGKLENELGVWATPENDCFMFGCKHIVIAIYKDYVVFSEDAGCTFRSHMWQAIGSESLPIPFHWSLTETFMSVWYEQ